MSRNNSTKFILEEAARGGRGREQSPSCSQSNAANLFPCACTSQAHHTHISHPVVVSVYSFLGVSVSSAIAATGGHGGAGWYVCRHGICSRTNNTHEKPQRVCIRVCDVDKMYTPFYPLRARKRSFGTRRGGSKHPFSSSVVAKVRTSARGGVTLETEGHFVNIQGVVCCPRCGEHTAHNSCPVPTNPISVPVHRVQAAIAAFGGAWRRGTCADTGAVREPTTQMTNPPAVACVCVLRTRCTHPFVGCASVGTLSALGRGAATAPFSSSWWQRCGRVRGGA